MTNITTTAINTLTAKLFTKLASLDLSSGIRVSYDPQTSALTVAVRGRTHHLITTDSPTAWALDGRRNWRAIKALCVAVCEAGDEPAPVTPGEPGDVIAGPRTRIMSREERKAVLADCPKKKGEPKPSPVFQSSGGSLNVTPAASRSASVILASLVGSAKAGSSRAPQSHRANSRRPR